MAVCCITLVTSASQTAVAVVERPLPCLQVYGDPLQHPQTENYWGNVNPIGERSCYDEGKRAAECLAFDYKREHNLEVRHRMLCSSSQFLVTGATVWGCSSPPGVRHTAQLQP